MDSLFWRRYLDYSRPVPFSVRYLQTPSQYPLSNYKPLHQHHQYYSCSPYRVLYVNGKRVKVYSSSCFHENIESSGQKATVIRKRRKTPSLILLTPRRCKSHLDLSTRTDSVWSEQEPFRQRCSSFSERYLAMQTKPRRRCYSYQDVSSSAKYSSQPNLSSNLSMSHFWGWNNRRWVSNVDLLSPSSAYGSLEDLQYYSSSRTWSTEYLFPTPFSKWYSSSQSESGFSGSGFNRSPRTPYSIGGSDFGDYRSHSRPSSLFGDYRSVSRTSSVFGDNIELSLPAKYERYDEDFNLVHTPNTPTCRSVVDSEVGDYGHHSHPGSVFSGSEIGSPGYREMIPSPGVLESSLRSHDWVSKTDFERHAVFGVDDETVSQGSAENLAEDGDFVSMHDKSLDVVYEDDDDDDSLTGEVFQPVDVDEDELDDAESLNSSSSTHSVVCSPAVSRDDSVVVDTNSFEEQFSTEDNSLISHSIFSGHIKINLSDQIAGDSEMFLINDTSTQIVQIDEYTEDMRHGTSQSATLSDKNALYAVVLETGESLDTTEPILETIKSTTNQDSINKLESIKGNSVNLALTNITADHYSSTSTQLKQSVDVEVFETSNTHTGLVVLTNNTETSYVQECMAIKSEPIHNYSHQKQNTAEDSIQSVDKDSLDSLLVKPRSYEKSHEHGIITEPVDNVNSDVGNNLQLEKVQQGFSNRENQISDYVLDESCSEVEMTDNGRSNESEVELKFDSDNQFTSSDTFTIGNIHKQINVAMHDPAFVPKSMTIISQVESQPSEPDLRTKQLEFEPRTDLHEDWHVDTGSTKYFQLEDSSVTTKDLVTQASVEFGTKILTENAENKDNISGIRSAYDPNITTENMENTVKQQVSTCDIFSVNPPLDKSDVNYEIVSENIHTNIMTENTDTIKKQPVSTCDIFSVNPPLVKTESGSTIVDVNTDETVKHVLPTDMNYETFSENLDTAKSNTSDNKLSNIDEPGKHVELPADMNYETFSENLDKAEISTSDHKLSNIDEPEKHLKLPADMNYESLSENDEKREIVTTSTGYHPDTISELSPTDREYLMMPTADQQTFKTEAHPPVVTYTDSCDVWFEQHASLIAQSDYEHTVEGSKQVENTRIGPISASSSLDVMNVNSRLAGENLNDKTECIDEIENRNLLRKGITNDAVWQSVEPNSLAERSIVTVSENSQYEVINDSVNISTAENRPEDGHGVHSIRESDSDLLTYKKTEKELDNVLQTPKDFNKETDGDLMTPEVAEKGSDSILQTPEDFNKETDGDLMTPKVAEKESDSILQTPKMTSDLIKHGFDQLAEDFDEIESSEHNSSKLTSSCESVDSGYDTLKKSWTKSPHCVSSDVKKQLFSDNTGEMSVFESDDSFVELEETSVLNELDYKPYLVIPQTGEKQCTSGYTERQEVFENLTPPKRLRVRLVKRTHRVTKTDVDVCTTHKQDNVVDAVKHTHLVKLEKTTITAEGPAESPIIIIDQSQIGKEITIADWSKNAISTSANQQHVTNVKNAVKMLQDDKFKPLIESEPTDTANILHTVSDNTVTKHINKNTDLESDGNDTNVGIMADTPDILDIVGESISDMESHLVAPNTCVVHVVSETDTVDSNTNILKTGTGQSEVDRNDDIKKTFTCSDSDDHTRKYIPDNSDTRETSISRLSHDHEDKHLDIPDCLSLASKVLLETAEQGEVIPSVLKIEQGEVSSTQSLQNVENREELVLSDPSEIYFTKNTESKLAILVCDNKRVGESTDEDSLPDQYNILTDAVNQKTHGSFSQHDKRLGLAEESQLESLINSSQPHTDNQQVNMKPLSSVSVNENNVQTSQLCHSDHQAHFLGEDEDINICSTENTNLLSDISTRDNGSGLHLIQIVEKGHCSNTADNTMSANVKTEFNMQTKKDGLQDLYKPEETSLDVGEHHVFMTTEDKSPLELESFIQTIELGNTAAIPPVYTERNREVNKGYAREENSVLDNRDYSDLSVKLDKRDVQENVTCVNVETSSTGDIPFTDIYDVNKAKVSSISSPTDHLCDNASETSVEQNGKSETGVRQLTANNRTQAGKTLGGDTRQEQRHQYSEYSALELRDSGNYEVYGNLGQFIHHSVPELLESDAKTALITGPETVSPSDVVRVYVHAEIDKENNKETDKEAENTETYSSTIIVPGNVKPDVGPINSCVTGNSLTTVNICKIHGLDGCDESCVTENLDSRNRLSTMNRKQEVEHYDNVGFNSVLEIIEEGLELIEEDIQQIHKENRLSQSGSLPDKSEDKSLYIQDPENRLDFLREQLLFGSDDETNRFIESYDTSEGFLHAADSTEDVRVENIRTVKVTGELSDNSLDTSFSSDQVDNVSFCEDVTDRLQISADQNDNPLFTEDSTNRQPVVSGIHQVGNFKSDDLKDTVSANVNSRWITERKLMRECTHDKHIHSFTSKELERNLQSFEELLKGFDDNSTNSVLSKLVFTVVFLKTASGTSYNERMKNLYHNLLFEDIERLQNHLCPVIYANLRLDSHRMQRYLLRGYSLDMATVWHTRHKRVLGSLSEQHEDDFSSLLQSDSSFQTHHGTSPESDQRDFHRLSSSPHHYEIVPSKFSPVPKFRHGDYEQYSSEQEDEDYSDSLMDYGNVTSAADDDSQLMEEFKKLELLEEDGLLLDEQFQRLRYYRSRFIKYNPYLQNNSTSKETSVPFRNTNTSDDDMDVN